MSFVTRNLGQLRRFLPRGHTLVARWFIAASWHPSTNGPNRLLPPLQVGDGTNFVLIFAGRLLEKATNLLQMGLSPTEVISGYEKAVDKALEILPSLVCYTLTNWQDEKVRRAPWSATDCNTKAPQLSCQSSDAQSNSFPSP